MRNPAGTWQLIRRHLRPLPVRVLPLAEAAGWTLAQDVRAERDLPPADRSAMDGYALRFADVAGGRRELRLVGEVAAGSPARPTVRPGTCVRILTGANVPPGADTVVMVEHTRERGGVVTLGAAVRPGANILKRGEDGGRGQRLLRRGDVLDATRIGACAAAGLPAVRVFGRPRLAVMCVGEELREAGTPAARHEQRNTNGPSLCAALALWGFGRVAWRVLPDRPGRLVAALRQCQSRCDAMLFAGGLSVGKYDFVRAAIEQAGATVRLHGVAMKPGKPFLYASLPGNRHIFGLPGNPLSALTGFYEFALPALRCLSGVRPQDCRPSLHLPLAGPLASKGGRVRFVLGRLQRDPAGLCVVPVDSRSSADLASAARADGAIIVPADVREQQAGDVVEFRPWRPLP